MVTLTWKSTLSRCYYIQKRLDLDPTTPWLDSGLGLIPADGASTTRAVTDTTDAIRFYRIKAVRPLAP